MDEPQRRFVIQQHDAGNEHWDVRLEHRGVLLSWAVPATTSGPFVNSPTSVWLPV